MKEIRMLSGLTLGVLMLGLEVCPARLDVVATTPDIGSIAKEIGGADIELSVLAKPTEDPHFIDAKPSFIVKLNRADVVLEGGAELEIGWLPALLDQARNAKLAAGGRGHVACAEGIQLLEIPSGLDRARGDIHAAGNPHFLMDPGNAAIAARHIGEAFASLDPAHAANYRANAARFVDDLQKHMTEWEKEMAPYKGQEIAAYHNSWLYFATRFGLKSELFLEPKPGVPPTPSHLAEVIVKMKENKVKVVLVDPFQNRRTAEAVAERTGARVVDVTQFPGGVKGTEGGYIQLMDYLAGSVAKALAGS